MNNLLLPGVERNDVRLLGRIFHDGAVQYYPYPGR